MFTYVDVAVLNLPCEPNQLIIRDNYFNKLIDNHFVNIDIRVRRFPNKK